MLTTAQQRVFETVLANNNRETAETAMKKLVNDKLPKLLDTADADLL